MIRTLPAIAVLAALSACAAAGGEPGQPGTDLACPETRSWNAYINAMPGPGARPTLLVTGEVNLPEGTTASLREGPLDRMMPPGQRFSLVVEPGSGPGGWQTVRASIVPALAQYRMVVIGCGGREVARIDQVGVAY